MKLRTLNEIWQERGLLLPAFATAIGVGYLPLLVLPWTFGKLVSGAGYTESKAGWIATAEIAALATASLVAAPRATRTGRRWLAAGGILVAALANAAASMASPVSTVFVAARMLAGAGCGVAVAVGNAAAVGSRNPTRAFAVLWFLMALWQLGMFSATPWVMGRTGLAGVYGLMAVACLTYLPLGWHLPDPVRTAARTEASLPLPSLRSWLSIAMLAAFLCFWLRDALVYSLSERLALTAHIDAQAFGTLLGIASLVGLAGPASAARLGAGVPSGCAMGISLLLVLGVSGAMASSASTLLFGAATLLMPATGLFAASLVSGLSAHVDPSGRIAAIGAGLGFVSEAIGPALGGSLVQFAGRGVFAATVVAVGALTAVAALAVRAGANARAARLAEGTTTPPSDARA